MNRLTFLSIITAIAGELFLASMATAQTVDPKLLEKIAVKDTREAIQYALSYLTAVKGAKAPDVKEALKQKLPKFKTMLAAAVQNSGLAADGLQSTGLVPALSALEKDLPAKLKDQKFLSEYLAWESDIVFPAGIDPVAGIELARRPDSQPLDKSVDVMKRGGSEIESKIKDLSYEKVAVVVDGLTDLVAGGGSVVLDLMAGRTAPVSSGISIISGAKQFAQGWFKVFG